MLKAYLKNVIFVGAGIVVGTGLIYAVSASTAEHTYYQDLDGDGYGSTVATTTLSEIAPTGFVATSSDCNDAQTSINPGATEVCDGVDNDCDGSIDEGVRTTFYFDGDNDLYGTITNQTLACTAPADYVATSSDCNDANSLINPLAVEVFDNVDNNCNGQVDEGISVQTYYRDADGDSYGNPSVSTSSPISVTGYVLNNTDCNDNNSAIHPGATEINDDLDNNCNGQIDEGFTALTLYRDADGDGYGNPSISISSTVAVNGYVSNHTDCNDNNSSIHPGVTEIFDGVDNNCNGQIDEGITVHTYYRDADGDSFGNPNISTTSPTIVSGYVLNKTDCNDSDAKIHPGAIELKDKIDNNCNGSIDEGFSDVSKPGDCGEYRNHGAYVSQWAHYTNQLKKEGTISGQEKGQMMKEAARTKNENKIKNNKNGKAK